MTSEVKFKFVGRDSHEVVVDCVDYHCALAYCSEFVENLNKEYEKSEWAFNVHFSVGGAMSVTRTSKNVVTLRNGHTLKPVTETYCIITVKENVERLNTGSTCTRRA